MTTRSAFVLAALAIIGTATDGFAAAPSFDCAAAEGRVQAAVCGSEALAAYDRRLAEVWRDALARARAMADAETAVPRLRAAQRGWIEGRDACWQAGDELASCVGAAYRDRIAELQARWLLVAASPSVVFRCEDGAEVVVTPMASDTPTVRLARGDTTLVAHRRVSASGVRWEASFGRWFWEKGREATAVFDQSAPPVHCERTD